MPAPPVQTPLAAAPLAVPGLQAADVLALMRAAQGSAGAGKTPVHRQLEGRYVALVAFSASNPSARVFTEAAVALGARMAQIAPADLVLGDPARASDTAHLLGRLYAAIGCAGLDSQSVALLKSHSGVPVLVDLAADTHASRLLADLMTLQQALHAAAAWPVSASPAPIGSHPNARLGVYGPGRSALLHAWKKLKAGAGVDVVDLCAPDANAHTAGCRFVCRPGTPPQLLLLSARSAGGVPQERSLAPQQQHNHRLVVQALLCHALGARR